MQQHANVNGSSFRLCVKTVYCKLRVEALAVM